jgi:SsrA-binding protein
MAPKKKKKTNPARIAIQNRRARHEYLVVEDIEAGIMLEGTEVKSLRTGQGNLQDSYAEPQFDGQGNLAIYLLNAYIPEYKQGNRFNHQTRRDRKLLLNKREIKRLAGKVRTKGLTLVPLDVHWNDKGLAKVQLGLCKGKSNYDKRQSDKDRTWGLDKQRAMRTNARSED